jgi:NDP-sugar pyrophosphorylase family protein
MLVRWTVHSVPLVTYNRNSNICTQTSCQMCSIDKIPSGTGARDVSECVIGKSCLLSECVIGKLYLLSECVIGSGVARYN